MTETGATPSKDSTADAGKSENLAKPAEKSELVVAALKQENAAAAATVVDEKADEMSRSMRAATRPHAFVIMPFGKKKGADGSLYDFNAIYRILIKPALEEAGFEPFRADEETASGDILTDMFQELLLADLCLCDLSIDNANVFYEVGIRHAFRKRGVVHIQAGRAYMPFDIFNVRTLPYHITAEGVPDPDYKKSDIQAIARMAKDTWASDRDAVHSPIFNLLTGLKEPERKMLKTASATGFWREFTEWMDKVTVAQRQKRIGDILLLTEEIGNPLIKEDAIGEAGRALADMGRHELALVQYRKGLEVNADNVTFRREEAFHLNRIGKVDDAIVKLEKLLNDYPRDSEATSYLGRIYKEMWVDSWKDIKDKNKRVKAAFNSYHWLIKAIKIYMKGFEIDLNNTYPGVNALTLSYMAIHLADKYDNKEDPDPAIELLRAGIADLRGALLFALESKAQREPVGYWTLISLAEVRVLTADNLASVTRAYRTALTASRRNISYLTTSINQLKILKGVGLREEYVQAGLNTLLEEMNRMDEEDNVPFVSKKYVSTKEREEGQVFLFTGYMVDFPGKEKMTFPADKEHEIRAEIRKKLEKFNAGPNDIAFVGGLSAGGEIIFAEVCAEKGIHVEAHLPLAESTYIREFVSPGGEAWVDRFYKVRSHPLVDEMYQSENIGEPKNGDDPYERNNRWTLYSSLVRGIDRVRLIALWNGQGGKPKDRDARLVRHMIELMRDTGGVIEQINPSKYIHTFIDGAFDGLPDLSKPVPVATSKAPSKSRLSEKKQITN